MPTARIILRLEHPKKKIVSKTSGFPYPKPRMGGGILRRPTCRVSSTFDIFSPYACGAILFHPQVGTCTESMGKKKNPGKSICSAHDSTLKTPPSCPKNRKNDRVGAGTKNGQPCTSPTNLPRGVRVEVSVFSDLHGLEERNKLSISTKIEKIAEIWNFA